MAKGSLDSFTSITHRKVALQLNSCLVLMKRSITLIAHVKTFPMAYTDCLKLRQPLEMMMRNCNDPGYNLPTNVPINMTVK